LPDFQAFAPVLKKFPTFFAERLRRSVCACIFVLSFNQKQPGGVKRDEK
jgi:hypothetical protein